MRIFLFVSIYCVLHLIVVGPVINPFIGKIIEVKKTKGEDYVGYYIITNRGELVVHHRNRVPYKRNYRTVISLLYEGSGDPVLLSDMVIKWQLPDSVLINPYNEKN